MRCVAQFFKELFSLIFVLARQTVFSMMAQWAVGSVVQAYKDSSPRIVQHLFYGATGISPEYLTIWFVFSDKKALAEAKDSGLCKSLRERTRRELAAVRYPVKYIPMVLLGFEAKENLDAAGGAFHYFK